MQRDSIILKFNMIKNIDLVENCLGLWNPPDLAFIKEFNYLKTELILKS